MSSLFGSLGTPKPNSNTGGGGLFGASSTSQPSTTSLFGSTLQPPSQPGGNSLFSTLPPSTQSSQPAGGSIFGTANPATQPTQAAGSTLFSKPATSTAPQQSVGSSIFGPPAPNPFGTSATQQQSQATASTLSQPQSQSQSQSLQQNGQRSGAYFDSLLEKSRKRAHGETALEELPSLQLGLGDLRQRIRKLGSTTQDQAADGRAQYLLAGSGVDLGAAVRDLSYFEAQTSRIERAQSAAPAAADVEGYLAKIQTQTTLSMIADGLSRSVRDFDAFLEDNVTMEWDAQRKRIYQHFGIKSKDDEKTTRDNFGLGASTESGGFGQSRRSKRRGPTTGSRASTVGNGSVFGRSGLQKSVIGTPGPIGTRQQTPFVDVKEKSDVAAGTQGPVDDRLRRDKEGKFAEKVQSLNAARVQNQPFPILQEFCNVESQNNDEYVEHVVKAYKGLMEIVGEASESHSVPGRNDMKERQFAAAYLDESQSSANAVQIKKRILQGASRHLEKQFFQDLEAFIAKNPREANLGGVPNVMSKVKAFVRLRAARKDLAPDDTDLQMLGDDYVWALIFYLLRSGHVREAVEYVASNAVAFRAIDRNFVTYITDYHNSSEKRLRRELQDRINNEYNQRVRIAPEGSIDPFRMACYNIIGRCDMVKKSLDGLYHDMPDWLWLQFILAREVNRVDEIASEVYGLNEVQATVDNIVSKHAASAPGFGVFFYLQILSGRFEQAVHFLYSYQYVDAVHFAIALDYYGMLRVAGPNAPEGDLLTFSTRGQPQLSFARMIGYYTQDFRAANVVAAVDYLTLLCLNSDLPGEAGKQQAAQCYEALRELVLESREFAQLLGDVREDGQRLTGAIEERIKLLGLADTDDFVKRVTIQAASIADDNGRVTDAVLLYHLAEEYDNVLVICNRALSEAVAVDVGEDGISLLPLRPRNEDLDDQLRGQRVNTLSLTSIDDPVVLAKSMYELYVTGIIYNGKFSAQNRNTCEVLLKIDSAKKLMAQNMWADAIDVLMQLDILPLTAGGDSTAVRQYAAKYSSLDECIRRLVPNLIIWAIRCCSTQRGQMSNGQYVVNDGTRRMILEDLKAKAKDLMMYSGFLKYRLPVSVNETLARIAAE